ncbi:MAG: hypothetical protein DF168_01709 [Candidatus Moanabacter tarae]|uniref:Cupin 2 conserved barrel domain-containing protein n=1 Tax=Candidatus Moanibacter tarae TaxID=2200854 RepID=A0A2Z4AFY0_9BACT|nr:MAG: hypothetical protein DF168_01709 [Candidatus Moanabacter tarae]|tara:strand:+ start:16445 stop:17638 length:1194 start_codon:yes stop_codon:yes gene_type:complete
MKTHENYRSLIEKAETCHQDLRSIFHIDDNDVALARLYAYAYRSQTIGAFHGCQEALTQSLEGKGHDSVNSAEILGLLKDLQNLGTIPIPDNFRALTYTLYSYDKWSRAVQERLERLIDSDILQKTGRCFRENIERITTCNGIYTARDDVLPEQSTFLVPNLGIEIASLIYGENFSWNSAYLPGKCIGATNHFHKEGIEIHLGYSPMHGATMLGDCATTMTEGYAMAIPAKMEHGMDNLDNNIHWVPFIFGSMTLAGWGVFFDVEARAAKASDLNQVPLESDKMNNSVYLEREIDRIAQLPGSCREVLFPPSATASGKCGALELGIAKVGLEGLSLPDDTYRIFSVVRGRAKFSIGTVSSNLKVHDHTGIPAGMSARIYPAEDDPLVILDAVIRPCS